MPVASRSGSARGGARRARLPRWIGLPLAVYAASRLVTLAAAYCLRFTASGLGMLDGMGGWDGSWYVRIATGGYPAVVPRGDGNAAQSVHAFFPLFPTVTRWVGELFASDHRIAGIAVNVLGGAVAAVLIWRIGEHVWDAEVATGAVLLWSFFPGAFVLSLVYSEGLYLAFASLCLLWLLRRRWLLAGLAAALTGLARPTGYVLALCCAWAALVAVRERREWKALAAPVLAPLGTVAFALFLWARTDDFWAWKYTQEHGWNQGFDLGISTARKMWGVLQHPLADFNLLMSFLAFVVVTVSAVLLWRARPPVLLWIYVVGIIVPVAMSTALTSTNRFVMTAFPLFYGLAHRLRGAALGALVGAFGGGLALFTVVSGSSLALTP